MIVVWLLWALMNGQASEVDSYMTKDGCERARGQIMEMAAQARQMPGGDRVPAGLTFSECEPVKVPAPKGGK